MFCTFGQIATVNYIGINPSSIKDRDLCSYKADNQICTDLMNKNFNKKVLDTISKG